MQRERNTDVPGPARTAPHVPAASPIMPGVAQVSIGRCVGKPAPDRGVRQRGTGPAAGSDRVSERIPSRSDSAPGSPFFGTGVAQKMRVRDTRPRMPEPPVVRLPVADARQRIPSGHCNARQSLPGNQPDALHLVMCRGAAHSASRPGPGSVPQVWSGHRCRSSGVSPITSRGYRIVPRRLSYASSLWHLVDTWRGRLPNDCGNAPVVPSNYQR